MRIGRTAGAALALAFIAILMAANKASAKDGLVGAWLQEGTIVPLHSTAPVFEFHTDGTAVYDTAGPRSHRGRYQIRGNRLIFAGWPPQQKLTYKIVGDQLTITSVAPGLPGLPPAVVITYWKRIPPMPLFGEAKADDMIVPARLNALVMSELAFARSWESDAIPVALSITTYGRGFYEIETDFESPKAAKQLQDYVTAHFVDAHISSIDPSDIAKPLPVNFIDFPKAIENARKYDMKGDFTKADLRVWGKHGPVWTVTGSDGVTLSALTGANIEGDVTGYKARYNAQWAKAIAGLRRLAGGNSPCADPLSFRCDAARSKLLHDRTEKFCQEIAGETDQSDYANGTATPNGICDRYGHADF